MFVVSGDKVPIKIWADPDMIENEAIAQLQNLARLPFVYKHVAVMPDAHAGKGSTVGTVIATNKAIIPSCVGVDIGCGMIAVKTPFKAERLEGKLPALRHSIERSIPVGNGPGGKRREPHPRVEEWAGTHPVGDRHVNNTMLCQCGTLGGGNHFIEICVDTEGSVWAMLHSGSRNLGKTLADAHIETAQDLMERFFITLPDKDLAYLVQGTQEFENYWTDLQYAQQYARLNREIMMDLVLKDLAHALNEGEPFEQLMRVNCHHNYTELEHHFGSNVYVTRKGAIRAREGDLGIIPGSMGTRSYIVRGKGNQESFCSSSHGAGRKMSRAKARSTFTASDLARQTEGVECRKDTAVIDEIPGAYKPIEQVMKAQEELVEVVAELKQVLCVKG